VSSLARAVRAYSLTLRTLDRLEDLMFNPQRALDLQALLPPSVVAISSPPLPPIIDELCLQVTDYPVIAKFAGVPEAGILGLSTLAKLRAAVDRYASPGKVGEFNRLLKDLAVKNRRLVRAAKREQEVYERAALRRQHSSRRSTSQSAMVDALLQLGLDTLEERVAHVAVEKRKGSKGRDAGQAGNKSSKSSARQVAAA